MEYKNKKGRLHHGTAPHNPVAGKHPYSEGILRCRQYYEVLNQPELIKEYAGKVLSRHHLKVADADLDRLISLIDSLYTVPSPANVAEKAKQKGIALDKDDVRKMCWILQGFQEAVNERKARDSA